MYPELTNLISSSQIRAFRRGYFLRLLTVVLLAIAALVLANAVLLLPSYGYARAEVARYRDQLAGLDASLTTAQEKEVNARIKALADASTYLSRLGKVPSATNLLRAILAVPHTGIALTGFTFTPASADTKAKMTLTGSALSRETLRKYVLSLEQLPYVDTADLPISAYAKESDIPFTITLTGSLVP